MQLPGFCDGSRDDVAAREGCAIAYRGGAQVESWEKDSILNHSIPIGFDPEPCAVSRNGIYGTQYEIADGDIGIASGDCSACEPPVFSVVKNITKCSRC
jgi:hypothetical protein